MYENWQLELPRHAESPRSGRLTSKTKQVIPGEVTISFWMDEICGDDV
jgi:hypothetical protein